MFNLFFMFIKLSPGWCLWWRLQYWWDATLHLYLLYLSMFIYYDRLLLFVCLEYFWLMLYRLWFIVWAIEGHMSCLVIVYICLVVKLMSLCTGSLDKSLYYYTGWIWLVAICFSSTISLTMICLSIFYWIACSCMHVWLLVIWLFIILFCLLCLFLFILYWF